MNREVNDLLTNKALVDPFNRHITYLRLSVTDRCDLRCTYCMKEKVIHFSLNHPKSIYWLMLLLTLGISAMIPMIQIDTDPENMLSSDQADRVFHNKDRKYQY